MEWKSGSALLGRSLEVEVLGVEVERAVGAVVGVEHARPVRDLRAHGQPRRWFNWHGIIFLARQLMSHSHCTTNFETAFIL